MDRISELPEVLFSDILSMLSIKDLLRTSLLSKRWLKLWELSRDLNFDPHNLLGSEVEIIDIGLFWSRYVERVDKFVKNYQGTKIDSFKVAFHLNYKHSSIIDQWITFAIARGVERIDLLLTADHYVYNPLPKLKCYWFPFHLFSNCDASTLRHLNLRNCLLRHPKDFNFVPFSNLRSLVLENTYVGETLITSLLSKCLLLEELTLMECCLTSMLDIVSSSLRHLKVLWCIVKSKSCESKLPLLNVRSLDCPKLTSLVCRECSLDPFSINAPLVKTIYFSETDISQFPNVLDLFTNLPQLEILNWDTFSNMHVVVTSLRSIGLFKTLKQLNFLVSCDNLEDGFEISWILTILKASPLLQKLSFMFAGPKLSADQKESNDVAIFSHNELKVVELGGCVGNWYEIELAMNVLKYVHSLEKIVLSPFWSYANDEESSHRFSDPSWFENGRERVREMLQGHAAGGAQLIIM